MDFSTNLSNVGVMYSQVLTDPVVLSRLSDVCLRIILLVLSQSDI